MMCEGKAQGYEEEANGSACSLSMFCTVDFISKTESACRKFVVCFFYPTSMA